MGETRLSERVVPARTGWTQRISTPLQILAVLTALWFAGRQLAGQWTEVRRTALDIRPQWGWILLGSLAMLLTHGALVQAWRTLLGGWDSAPPFWTSARIWATANLGKYIPGKVWSIGALSVLAGRAGVSGPAAASAAILGTLLNIGAGFGIVAISGAAAVGALRPWMRTATIAGAVLFVIGVALLPLLLPPVVDWIVARRGLAPVSRHVSAGRLWSVTLVHALSWIGYGVGFWAFSRGVTPQVTGPVVFFITAYAASYLIGYLVLFAPGGIGFREWALVAMLVVLGMALEPSAAVLAAVSRVWITIIELVPGLVALGYSSLSSRSPRAGSP